MASFGDTSFHPVHNIPSSILDRARKECPLYLAIIDLCYQLSEKCLEFEPSFALLAKLLSRAQLQYQQLFHEQQQQQQQQLQQLQDHQQQQQQQQQLTTHSHQYLSNKLTKEKRNGSSASSTSLVSVASVSSSSGNSPSSSYHALPSPETTNAFGNRHGSSGDVLKNWLKDIQDQQHQTAPLPTIDGKLIKSLLQQIKHSPSQVWVPFLLLTVYIFLSSYLSINLRSSSSILLWLNNRYHLMNYQLNLTKPVNPLTLVTYIPISIYL